MRGRRVDSEELLGDVQGGAALISKSPTASALPEASARGGCQSACGAARRPRALGGVAFGHSLLLGLGPWASVVRAAIAAASVLFGQQALPLGFVVREMAEHALRQGAVSREAGPFPEEGLHDVGHET